jgi:acyl-coenzyme A synthetase/AMP-(fatty) acid ligase/kynurenine formamidase
VSATARLQATIDAATDRTFVVDGATGRVVTYGEMLERAAAIGDALRERGVGRGDRVAVSLPNSAELAAVYVAALAAGVVVIPLGSGFGRRELRDVLARSAPALALAGGARPNAAIEDVAGELGIATATVRVGDADGELDPWGLPAVGRASFAQAGDDDLASIHFTSGSTGVPRGVGHRIGDFVRNGERYGAAAGLDAARRFHSVLPMTYMAGYYNLLLMPLALGASVVLDRAFDARSVLRFWDVAREHEVDVLWLVPTIIAMLLKVDRGPAGREFCREHVRHAACGTAPLDPDLRERFEAEYGVGVHDSYGLSETLLATASTARHPAPRGGVGRALPGVGVRVAAEPGTPGPVLIRSEDTMVGYLQGCDDDGRPRFDAAVPADGWLETGDLGTLDADGEVRITGRTKEIIIRGGVNVSAVEIEHALQNAAPLQRLAVVGAPHEILGEQVAAVVSLSDDGVFDDVERALREAARTLEEGHRPDLYLQIDEMPTTPTGKVRKGALRDLVIDALGLPARGKGFTVDAAEAPPTPVPAGNGGWPASAPVDLTHPIREGMVSFPSPNHPEPEVTVLARHETQGRMTRRLVLGTHTGTHADAPLHFVPAGGTIDAVTLDTLVGPATLADLSDVGELEAIGRERLERALGGPPRHPRVLLRFDWSRRFVDLDFYHRSPYLAADACQWLVDHGVRLLGFDIASPDDPRQGQDSAIDSPNHHLLLGAGVVLLEYLANLDRLPVGDVHLVALPLPIAGGDGAPMRVIAFP